MLFYVGLSEVAHANRFDRAFISVNRLRRRNRKSPFAVNDWIMDSGAFTTILKHGGYPEPVDVYADHIRRWGGNGRLIAAVAQDYMCERAMLARTGLSIADHQRLTIERYDALTALDVGGVYIMPVLQGYAPADYVRHVRSYGPRLAPGAYVGVGSLCKRNGSPAAVEDVLRAIHRERPDLRLHGFGLKATAFSSPTICRHLYSADSMAWSFAARWEGRDRNGWREAQRFSDQIALAQLVSAARPEQTSLLDLCP